MISQTLQPQSLSRQGPQRTGKDTDDVGTPFMEQDVLVKQATDGAFRLALREGLPCARP
jgi:hypothetical protein